MTTNQSFCFASLHGGNHGSDPKNPLQSAPFRNGNIFIGYYDEPNTPFGDNPCLGDILKNSHIEPVHFFKDYHRSLEGTKSTCFAKAAVSNVGTVNILQLLK